MIKVRERDEYTFGESAYVPEILKGLGVTLKHLSINLLKPRRDRLTATIRYPEEKREYPQRFRGRHRLTRRSDGSPKCVACCMCATACPAKCIRIAAEEHEDRTIEKRPSSFQIDLFRCIYCGLCVDACPEDAIRMDTGAHPVPMYEREQGVWKMQELLSLEGREQMTE